MKKYFVKVPIIKAYATLEVFANDEESAKEKAYLEVNTDHIELDDVEFAYFEDGEYEVYDYEEEFGKE